jgi:hypothetical protein
MLKLYEKMLALLPHSIIAAELALLVWLIMEPKPWKLVPMLLLPYVLPLVLFRVTNAFLPLKDGAHYYNPAQASPWVMSFYLQALYGAFPQLERNLIVLGLFSPWLRLWGSKVGTNVLWTSHTQILDRSGLEIGDNVFFGHMCLLTPHVTDLRHGKLLFYFRKIHIGHNVFLGGACRIGPGVRIDDGVALPAATDIFIGKHITKDTYKKTSRGAQ